MDNVGPRLARIVKEMRTLQNLLEQGAVPPEQMRPLIDELATVVTAALGWRILADANGVTLPDEDEGE